MTSSTAADAKPKLLIVEDDPGICSQYRWAFPSFSLLIVNDRAQAIATAQREQPPLAIIDLGLPPDPDGISEGLSTLEALQRLVPGIKAIVATGNGERATALAAVSKGAYDFCEKPVELDLMRMVLERGRRLHELEEENRRLTSPGRSPIERVVTASPVRLKVCRSIEKLAGANVPVLLLGESGTGKELLAQALHGLGPRSKQPFVAINCGAIPENLLESELFGYERGAFTGAHKQTPGKIESANHGTLFLDEIGDLPHPLQVKLLRFLQDQVVERIGGRQRIQVDVRIVSATNQSLEERIADGRFRGDLFYRMNSVTVRIPALRERAGDAVLLANVFLGRFNREFGRSLRGFTQRGIDAMSTHPWPGNVRELENRVKRAVVMAETTLIDAPDLELAADADPADLDLRAARHRAERDVIVQAIARSQGRLSAAAKMLGISRPTLYGLIDAHGLEVDVSRAADPADADTDATDSHSVIG
jgi:two-component system NtrC family response regulator